MHTVTSLAGRVVGGVVIALLFMGSTLLTPLYELYRAAYGFSTIALGFLYAVYVIGNLIALLFLGRLSDQVGRRPVVLASLALTAVSALLFLSAQGATSLFAGRIISGLAVGLGSGAATAWITELTAREARAGAASVMTSFNFAGLAIGTILAGVLSQYAPYPLRLSFVVYLALMAFAAVAVTRTRETLQAGRGNPHVELRPRIGVPSGLRVAFLAPAAAGFSAMALVGFFAALGPTTLHNSLHVTNRAVSALAVAELFIVAALVIIATRSLRPRLAMTVGLVTIPLSVALLVAAQRFASLPLMLLSTAVSGLSASLGYRGGLAVVTSLAPSEQRAEVASSYFVCCFLGNALPIIGVTALSQGLGANIASLAFAVVLSVIGVAALCVARLQPRELK